jgi:hypothetical protein
MSYEAIGIEYLVIEQHLLGERSLHSNNFRVLTTLQNAMPSTGQYVKVLLL